MSVEILAVLAFVLIFALSGWRGTNMGLLALGATFLLGTLAFGKKPVQLLEGFPASLFLVLVGVTYLFGIARANGTIDWTVTRTMSLVKDRVALIPWVLFLLATGLAAAGAASPAAVAIVAPIGISFGLRNRMNPLYPGLMAVNGAAAGSYAPSGILGGIVTKGVTKFGIHIDPAPLFLSNLAFGVLMCVITWFVFGRRRLAPGELGAVTHDDEQLSTGRPSLEIGVTLAAILALVVGSTAFGLDTGFLAAGLAASLALLFPASGRAGAAHIAWEVVLLVCGIVTFVGLLQSVGVVDNMGRAVTTVAVPLIAALLICYIAGVVSAFASTTGIIALLVPLSIPFLQSGAVSTAGFIAALTISATVVDASPFSTNGALVVANAPVDLRADVYRRILLWGGAVTLVAPCVAWVAFVVSGMW